ncbi:MAG: hypothetical protein ACI4O7_12290 [Aristaeellaceae bacterium]
MAWLNPFGLVIVAVMMIPNIIFALKCRDGFANRWQCRPVELLEQAGRFSCFLFMVVNVPGTWRGWPSDEAFALYCIVDAALLLLYCGIWAVCFRRNSLFRAVALSVIPSVIFLFSGIISRSLLLTAGAVIFAPCHIAISVMNAK